MFKEGGLVAAGKCFQELINLYPEDYTSWGGLGNCLAYLGKKKEAIECYKKALSINPGYEFAKKNMNMIKSMTEEQLLHIGALGAMIGAKHNLDKRDVKTKKEGINVWDEVDKFLREENK